MNMNKKRKTVGNCEGKDGNEEKVFPPVQEIKKCVNYDKSQNRNKAVHHRTYYLFSISALHRDATICVNLQSMMPLVAAELDRVRSLSSLYPCQQMTSSLILHFSFWTTSR